MLAPGSDQFLSAARAECANTVLLSESVKQNIYAVPLAPNSTSTRLSLGGNPATSIAFEPITNRAVMPFQGANPQLGAFLLGGTSTAPTLTQLPAAGEDSDAARGPLGEHRRRAPAGHVELQLARDA